MPGNFPRISQMRRMLRGQPPLPPSTPPVRLHESVVQNKGSAPGTGIVHGRVIVICSGTPEALTLPTLRASEFVARLDVNGKPQWAAPIRDSGRLVSEILAASPASLIVAGDFQETVNVGSPPRTLTSDADTTYFARFGP